jgi:hypothetical protein
MQTFAQAPQNNSAWQPPLPLTIVGQGFGYLSGLPWVGLNPPKVDIQAYSQPPFDAADLLWDTANGSCQVYISDWTDSRISLLVGLPQSPVNNAGQPLSPLLDMSPQTRLVRIMLRTRTQEDLILDITQNSGIPGADYRVYGCDDLPESSANPYSCGFSVLSRCFIPASYGSHSTDFGQHHRPSFGAFSGRSLSVPHLPFGGPPRSPPSTPPSPQLR